MNIAFNKNFIGKIYELIESRFYLALKKGDFSRSSSTGMELLEEASILAEILEKYRDVFPNIGVIMEEDAKMPPYIISKNSLIYKEGNYSILIKRDAAMIIEEDENNINVDLYKFSRVNIMFEKSSYIINATIDKEYQDECLKLTELKSPEKEIKIFNKLEKYTSEANSSNALVANYKESLPKNLDIYRIAEYEYGDNSEKVLSVIKSKNGIVVDLEIIEPPIFIIGQIDSAIIRMNKREQERQENKFIKIKK